MEWGGLRMLHWEIVTWGDRRPGADGEAVIRWRGRGWLSDAGISLIRLVPDDHQDPIRCPRARRAQVQ